MPARKGRQRRLSGRWPPPNRGSMPPCGRWPMDSRTRAGTRVRSSRSHRPASGAQPATTAREPGSSVPPTRSSRRPGGTAAAPATARATTTASWTRPPTSLARGTGCCCSPGRTGTASSWAFWRARTPTARRACRTADNRSSPGPSRLHSSLCKSGSGRARRLGLRRADAGAGHVLDARELPQDANELAAAVRDATVIGRVTPQQKRAIVGALQGHGHVVAMTGDGVNDVLALKACDVGIAMGSGTPASRGVARLVLLDDAFATLPRVVAEGRRVIGNVDRVSRLFLTKTAYAVLIALAVAIAAVPYPFYPRHLTIISTLSIGLPAFFLALAPNADRVSPGFLARALRFAVPAGIMIAAASFGAFLTIRSLGLGL